MIIFLVFPHFPEGNEESKSAYGGKAFNYIERASCIFVLPPRLMGQNL